jgi:hypothetical protein
MGQHVAIPNIQADKTLTDAGQKTDKRGIMLLM